MLTVRKRGTSVFMLPGGKPEPGESAVETAVREIEEELGITLDAADLRPLGSWETDAANEPGHLLRATVFETGRLDLDPAPRGEIVELEWVHPLESLLAVDQAPLNREHVFPVLGQRDIREAAAGSSRGGEDA